MASFIARFGIIAVFLAAFSIPVSFHTVTAVGGANSISSSLSFTSGGVGVTQALNVVVLEGLTSTANATAYSRTPAADRAMIDDVSALSGHVSPPDDIANRPDVADLPRG